MTSTYGVQNIRTPYAAGHSYNGITVADNARAHVGDINNYNIVECNKSMLGSFLFMFNANTY